MRGFMGFLFSRGLSGNLILVVRFGGVFSLKDWLGCLKDFYISLSGMDCCCGTNFKKWC